MLLGILSSTKHKSPNNIVKYIHDDHKYDEFNNLSINSNFYDIKDIFKRIRFKLESTSYYFNFYGSTSVDYSAPITEFLQVDPLVIEEVSTDLKKSNYSITEYDSGTDYIKGDLIISIDDEGIFIQDFTYRELHKIILKIIGRISSITSSKYVRIQYSCRYNKPSTMSVHIGFGNFCHTIQYSFDKDTMLYLLKNSSSFRTYSSTVGNKSVPMIQAIDEILRL